jgi:hypothetical protein
MVIPAVHSWSILRHYRKPLSGQWVALPGPAPEPSEVRPEYCLLAWSLPGLPQSELVQRAEVLLLLADLELKHSNDTFVTQLLCSLAEQHINTKAILVLLH